MPCIPKHLVDKFLQALKDGKVDPDKLTAMTSEERRAFLTPMVGEANAKWANAQFESKLLLKHQQEGIVNWAKSLGGLKPAARRDLISRVEKMTEILNPENEQSFLEDLAAQRLGTSVSLEEAANISSLAHIATEAKATMEESTRRTIREEATPEEMAYGSAVVAFNNYRKDLISEAGRKTVLEMLQDPMGTITKAAGQAKSLKASMDVSALFRQGMNTIKTSPGLWLKNAVKTFGDIRKTIGTDEKVLDTIDAEIVSDPQYERMKKAKLDIGNMEEAFPEPVFGKIPGARKLYKASEVAFTGFVRRLRVSIFKKHIEIMKNYGIDVDDPIQLEALGTYVNSLTGRGHLGKFEPAANTFNTLFFAPRFVKSQFDILTASQFQRGITPYVRAQAALNLLKIVGVTAATLTIAKAMNPDSVDTDEGMTISSDFGKIKSGGYTFDTTGGWGSLFVLAMRQAQGKTKSATTGITKSLTEEGFTAKNRLDVIYNYLENKLSPVSAVIRDLLKGRTFEGEKPTVGTTIKGLAAPITLSNIPENFAQPDKAMAVVALIADGLGINANLTKETAETTVQSFKAVEKEITRLQNIGDKEAAESLEKLNEVTLKRGEKLAGLVDNINDIKSEIKDVTEDLRMPEEKKKLKLQKLNERLKKEEDKAATKFKEIRDRYPRQ